MNPRVRRSWWRRRPPAAPPTGPSSDDVPTNGPTTRPQVVLLELPTAVLDFTALRDSGFGEGPIGLAGAAVLRTLACAGRRLDDGTEFDRALAAAVTAGIFAGDLDHGWDEADPDGHHDNTWLGAKYRTAGYVLDVLQSPKPYSDALPAVTDLRSMGVRPVAIPFLGSARTAARLGPELTARLEFPDVPPVESLPELLSAISDHSGVARTDVRAVTATRAMTEAAMAAGLGTVWVDRVGRIRSSVYDGRTGTSRTFRWGSGTTPMIVDDLPAAVRFLSELPAPA